MILYCTYVEIIITHLDPQNFDLEKTIIKNFNIFCGLPPTFQTDQTWSVKIIFLKKYIMTDSYLMFYVQKIEPFFGVFWWKKRRMRKNVGRPWPCMGELEMQKLLYVALIIAQVGWNEN